MLEMKIFRSGRLVDLSIGFWRARCKAVPADMGIEAADVPDPVQMPVKHLMPDDAMEPLTRQEQDAREVLKRFGHHFVIGNIWFVPNSAWPKVEQELSALQDTFHAEAKKFADLYESRRDTMLLKYPDVLHAEDYPPKGKLKFTFAWVSFTLAPTEDAKSAALEDAFVRASVDLLRGKVGQACQAVSGKLAAGKGIDEKNRKRLLQLAEEFKLMNWVGDKDFEQRVDALIKTLEARTAEEVRSSLDAQQELRRAVTVLAEMSTDAAAGDSVTEGYFRAVSVKAPSEAAPQASPGTGRAKAKGGRKG